LERALIVSCNIPSRRGGVGPIRTKPRSAPGRSEPKKPKTAEELDKELDAFMGDGNEAAPSAAVEADVDMA
jgi:THO complex subunit 4